ncbi:MAG: GNAT family N-acetyltransferase [Planctomycetota bacterium]
MTTATPPATVAIARSDAELQRLRPTWQRLHRHPNADFEFTRALLAAHPERAPFVLAIPGLDDPVAVLVGRLARTRLPIRFGYRTLMQPRIRAIELVQGGVLTSQSPDPEVMQLLARCLGRELAAGTADVLRAEHLPLDHPLATALLAAGARPARPLPDLHWVASLPGTFDEFLAARSRNTRRNVRRFEKGFLDPFADRHEIRRYDRPDQLETLAGEIEAVARTTYHRGLGAGFVDGAQKRALLAQGLAAGTYRAWVLHVDGAPAAFWDGRVCCGVLHTETTGYLPALAEQRPGWYLLLHVLRELCADPAIHAVDFGIGDAQYKQMLCDRSWPEQPLQWFAPTLRARWLQGLSAAADRSARWARGVLDRAGLTQRIKQRWRRRLAAGANPAPAAPNVTPTDPPADPSRMPPGS